MPSFNGFELNSNKTIGNLKLLNKLTRPIGFEVEIANWGSLPLVDSLGNYSFTRDTSVYPSGTEMRVEPAVCDKLVRKIQYLGNLFSINECKVNSTCGFHVHVDGGDYSYWDLRRLLTLWAAIEGDCFKYLISANRNNNIEKKNRYYKPSGERISRHLPTLWDIPKGCILKLMPTLGRRCYCGDLSINGKLCSKCYKKTIGHSMSDYFCTKCTKIYIRYKILSIYMGDVFTYHEYIFKNRNIHDNILASADRYTALNLVSWFSRGTFEFRLKEGLVKAEEMLPWVLFCGWIVEAGSSLKDSVVKGINNLNDFINVQVDGKYFIPHDTIDIRGWIQNKMRGSE